MGDKKAIGPYDTINDFFKASKIPPGQPGSLWVEQKPCPSCKQMIWWAMDGHDGKRRSPQVHSCRGY